MRLRYFLLFCALLAWFGCDGARAQTSTVSPDCIIKFSFTVAQAPIRVPATGFPNKVPAIQNLPCTTWAMNYQAPTTVTAISIELDSAPDTAGAAGAWGAFAGSVVSGAANPLLTVSLPSAFIVRQGSPAWVSVNLNSATGTGTITGAAYGWVIPPSGFSTVLPSGTQDVNIKAVGGVATPDSSVPVLSGCPLSAVFNTSSSGNVQIVPASGSTVIYICEISFAANSASDVKLTTGTGVNCAGGGGAVDLTGLYKTVSALALDANGALRGPAGSAVCINQSAANILGGTILYAQF